MALRSPTSWTPISMRPRIFWATIFTNCGIRLGRKSSLLPQKRVCQGPKSNGRSGAGWRGLRACAVRAPWLASWEMTSFAVLEREVRWGASEEWEAAGLDFEADLPQEWAKSGAVGFRISQQPAPQGWIFGVRRFRVFRLGRSGEAVGRYPAASGQSACGAATSAFSSRGLPTFRRRIPPLRNGSTPICHCFRTTLGAYPSQRVHPRTLAAARARRRERKLGGREDRRSSRLRPTFSPLCRVK